VNSAALRTRSANGFSTNVAARGASIRTLDIYNESYHTGSNSANPAHAYWGIYGVDGVAGIYKEVDDALAASGSSARRTSTSTALCRTKAASLCQLYMRPHGVDSERRPGAPTAKTSSAASASSITPSTNLAAHSAFAD